MGKKEIFYTSPNGAGGDIIPFYDEGEYRLFFLGKGWTCVSTKDHLHFHDEYKTGIHGGTGSVLKVDGMYQPLLPSRVQAHLRIPRSLRVNNTANHRLTAFSYI